MSDQDFRKATFEALFWWQRSECQYSIELRNAFAKRHEEGKIGAFVESSFSKFLADYSIRRNLRGKGLEPVEKFVEKCFEERGLIENLLSQGDKGKTIDKFVDIVEKDKALSGGQRLTSLIAKTSFLFMPGVIPLYDQLAKKALENIQGIQIPSFSVFLSCFEEQKREWSEPIKRFLKEQSYTMNLFPEFEGIEDREDFFVHRVVDKLLWIKGKSTTQTNFDT